MAGTRQAIKKNPEEDRFLKKPLENLNSFLYKLWSLVNDETLPAIHWSQDGEKIVIDNPTKFTAKVLTNYDKKIFKTRNISSFIRQLNLYGFRRIKETSGKIPITFKHDSFKRGRMDLLVNVKRKKPAPNKPLRPSCPTTPLKSREATAVPCPGLPLSTSRYQCLPTPQHYPAYFNPSSLTRKNVHMPFITPFAVNNGPTYINLGSNSTFFGKHNGHDQLKITHSDVQNEEKQTIEQPEIPHHGTTIATEKSYYPWRQHGFLAGQEPGITGMNLSYGNDVAFQVMMHNQGSYPKYTPALVKNPIFSNLPIATSYRSYGDNSESLSYSRLPNYSGPVNSMVSFPYRTPEIGSVYNLFPSKNIPENPSKFVDESLPSCSFSASVKSASEQYNNSFPDDGNPTKKQCAFYGKTLPCNSSVNEEKECSEEKKN